jgi:hypothetical protein
VFQLLFIGRLKFISKFSRGGIIEFFQTLLSHVSVVKFSFHRSHSITLFFPAGFKKLSIHFLSKLLLVRSQKGHESFTYPLDAHPPHHPPDEPQPLPGHIMIGSISISTTISHSTFTRRSTQ